MSFAETGTLATGLYDFEGVRDDNLPFKKGEVITIIEMNKTGWWKGVNSKGDVGIFPYNYVVAKEEDDSEFKIVRALVDYDAQERDELTFGKGDLITILKPIDEEWFLGRLFARASTPDDRLEKRIVGRFQKNFVESTEDFDTDAALEEQAQLEEDEKSKARFSRAIQAERFEVEKLSEQKILEEEKKMQQKEREREELDARVREAQKAAEQAATLQRNASEELAHTIEVEKKRIEDELDRMRQEIERHAREAEEAIKRAEAAENALAAAKAEKERLKIIAEKKTSLSDTTAAENRQKREEAVAKKVEEAKEANKGEDGFETPAPMPAKPVSKLALRFQKLGKGAENCKTCAKPVAPGPFGMKAMGSSWHKDCFKCSTCGKILRANWLEHKGFPYCERCHKAGFGAKGFGFGGAVAANYTAP